MLQKIKQWAIKSAEQPKSRLRQLFFGIGLFFIGIMVIYWAASIEHSMLFYAGIVIIALASCIALPGYLGLLIWRLSKIHPSRTNKF